MNDAQITDEDPGHDGPFADVDREADEAQASVADLEARYVEGEDIKPEDVEAAEQRSRWAQLKAKRVRRQAEKDAERERVKALRAFKEQIADQLSPDHEQAIADAYRKALTAVGELIEAADQRNDVLHQVHRRALGSEGVRKGGEFWKSFDGLNGLAVSQGLPERVVELDGQEYRAVAVNDTLAGVVTRALQAQGRKGGGHPDSNGPVAGSHLLGAKLAHERFSGEDA